MFGLAPPEVLVGDQEGMEAVMNGGQDAQEDQEMLQLFENQSWMLRPPVFLDPEDSADIPEEDVVPRKQASPIQEILKERDQELESQLEDDDELGLTVQLARPTYNVDQEAVSFKDRLKANDEAWTNHDLDRLPTRIHQPVALRQQSASVLAAGRPVVSTLNGRRKLFTPFVSRTGNVQQRQRMRLGAPIPRTPTDTTDGQQQQQQQQMQMQQQDAETGSAGIWEPAYKAPEPVA